MTEGVANISECERMRFHVDEDFAATEFIPSGDGQTCRVVGTNLSNPATPLVRYDVGDMVTLWPEGCSCGRPGRVICRLDGRIEDYVTLSDGTKVGRMDHIFKDMGQIREAQIFQDTPGVLVYRIVRRCGYSQSDEEQLLVETRRRIGRKADVRIQYVESLPKTNNGKLRFVTSTIK